MEFNRAFADALRMQRKAKKLSQEALADRVESNQRYISEIESCIKNPTLKFVHDLAVALDTPLSSLIQQAERKMKNHI